MAFGLGLGRLGLTGGARWTPAQLWPLGAASPGLWIDPSTTTASYQDSAGTTALSAIGTVLDTSNPVGLMLDRKGGATSPADPGIHLSQSTAPARAVMTARKNLLVGTATLSTQNVTVAAIPHTISFTGGGTLAATGTYTGALTNGQTFTPTAGTLTLTPTGSITTAQLERGSVATTYQPVVSASSYTATGFPVATKFDAVDDALASATFTANTVLTDGMDCLIAVRRDSAASAVCGLYNAVADATKFFGMAESGSGSGCVGTGAGTPTIWVDGVQLTGGTAVTRGTLHTALTAGAWHILEFRGLDLSTWTAAGFGAYTSYIFNGAAGEVQLFGNGQDANRALSLAAMATYFGVALP